MSGWCTLCLCFRLSMLEKSNSYLPYNIVLLERTISDSEQGTVIGHSRLCRVYGQQNAAFVESGMCLFMSTIVTCVQCFEILTLNCNQDIKGCVISLPLLWKMFVLRVKMKMYCYAVLFMSSDHGWDDKFICGTQMGIQKRFIPYILIIAFFLQLRCQVAVVSSLCYFKILLSPAKMILTLCIKL